ncbi:hypothetical protein CU005_2538 [Enterococcus faecium]|nr:hypothetical protein [Enterococcus faecium]
MSKKIKSAKLDMRQFSFAKSELYYSCKEEKAVFINLLPIK